MTEHLKREHKRIRELRDPLIGRFIDGEFQILKWIGKGAYSNVYLAAQTSVNDRLVAVKVIRRAQSAYASSLVGATGQNPFEHEMRFNRLLRGTAVVRTIRAGRTDNGVDYIAMEYVDGVNLDQHIRAHGPLDIPQVVQLADQVLAYADEAHGQGFAHCDLKPDNVMMRQLPSGVLRFKVLDLGQARFYREPQPRPDGQPPGTPAFIAPEVAQGGPVNPRAEVYACATVLYEALTGCHALELERHTAEGFMDYLRDPTQPIPTRSVLELRQDCPQELADAVEWGLDRDPQARPATAAELRQAVLEAAEVSGVHPDQQPPPGRGVVDRVRSTLRKWFGR